jgi:serine/threonine protein phosphatase PrpC
VVPQIVPRFDFRVECAVAGDLGRSRESYEDAHLLAPEIGLFAVADGMGGHRAGEVAARCAIEEVGAFLRSRRAQDTLAAYVARPDLERRRAVFVRMRQAVAKADERVRAEAAKPEHEGMGTTLDLAWVARDHAFLAHVGDGRMYLGRVNATIQLTQDHARFETLKAAGVIRPQRKLRGANRLLNAIGVGERASVDTLYVDLDRGDRLLLCTDGVHRQIESEARLGELLRVGDAQGAARALIGAAGSRGRDNATALVLEICDRFVKREAADRGLRATDLERARASALWLDMPQQAVLATLAAAVEIELDAGARVPRAVASDLVAYVVLEGVVSCSAERRVSTGALLFAESLVGVASDAELPVVEARARLLRLRGDDFAEVCSAAPGLAAQLYRRIATHLARSAARRADAASEPVPSEPVPSEPAPSAPASGRQSEP